MPLAVTEVTLTFAGTQRSVAEEEGAGCGWVVKGDGRDVSTSTAVVISVLWPD